VPLALSVPFRGSRREPAAAQFLSLGRSTFMPFPNQDCSKRGYLLPAGCMDLAGAVKYETALFLPHEAAPLITQLLCLPKKVSAKYLAELSGTSLYTVFSVVLELRVRINDDLSIDFEEAAKILLKYGIATKRAI
jgi:hypothetical protein